MTASTGNWFFTEGYEESSERRGDALGLRQLADSYSDCLAPGLNNGTFDARWISILSWCLAKSHEAWEAASDSAELRTPTDRRERYAWLRPLELLWIARCLKLPDQGKGRQRRLHTSVRRWLQENEATERFGLSPEQFDLHRQRSVYATYRTVFTRVAGMTKEDGYTPTSRTLGLVKRIDTMMGGTKADIKGRQFRKWRRDKERFWADYGWHAWRTVPERCLPRPFEEMKALPEANDLAAALFGADEGGKRRLAVVKLLGAYRRRPSSHAALCRLLEQELNGAVAGLWRCARLADSYLTALLAETNRLYEINAARLAKMPAVRARERAFIAAARAWSSEKITLKGVDVAKRLASAAVRAKGGAALVRAIVDHHQEYHAGLGFIERSGTNVTSGRIFAGDRLPLYRFRLWSLARIAVQCQRLVAAANRSRIKLCPDLVGLGSVPAKQAWCAIRGIFAVTATFNDLQEPTNVLHGTRLHSIAAMASLLELCSAPPPAGRRRT